MNQTLIFLIVFIAWSYPIYLNFSSRAKELDAYSASHVGTSEGAVDPDSILVATKDLEASRIEKY